MCSTCGQKGLGHEMYRIRTFQERAKDKAHLGHLLTLRARRWSGAKRERFLEALRLLGNKSVATLIELRGGRK